MPHIILSGIFDFEGVWKKFAPFRADSNGWIIKINHCLNSSRKGVLVFDCTAVRSGFSQDFYLRVEDKGTISVRVDPYMRIERNEGVQRAIVAVADYVRDHSSTVKLEKSNLPPEVIVEFERGSIDEKGDTEDTRPIPGVGA